ncbi:MAG: hypothetical protein L3J43_06350 [Sulfurovum sp.]|nr:hypothetical protein [Sulfurovum sp.]
MSEEVEKVRRPKLKFNESEIKFALSVMDKMKNPVELMYYLLDRENENPFVLIFISSKNVDLGEILKQEKRDTDVLFKINTDKNLYAIICQETKVDGAYRFAERLLRTVLTKGGNPIYCTELEVTSSKYSVKDILFKAIEMYITAVKENNENEITFRSL